MDLKGRNFLTLKDFTAEEIIYLVDLAAELKEKKKKGIPVDTLRGKNVALIFEKTSTRTRCAFEVAAHDLGMGTTYLDPSGSQIGKKESIRDTARVLGRMFEGIEYRGFGQEIVEELAKYAGVPVWNGLTNEYHPTQMLADMLTIREHLGHLKGVKLIYMGDARYNMGNSLMIACAKLGMHFVACAPEKYFPNAALVEECQDYAKESGGSITLTEDVKAGTKDADVIYTDVWGIKVNRVELKNIIPPAAIQDAMEKQMKAERERREAILRAEGEKKSTVLVAEGKKESAILDAEAEKTAAILRAEAQKEKMIREAEGQAEAILKVQKANADGLRFLKDAGADETVLALKSFEALTKVADGKATKIIIPSELQNVAGTLTALAETVKTEKKETADPV